MDTKRIAYNSIKYSLGITQAAVLNDVPMYDILCPAGSTRSVGIYRMELIARTAVASLVQVCFPDTVGTQNGPFTPVDVDVIASAAQARVANAWTVAPAPGAALTIAFLALPATAFERRVIEFPPDDPLILTAGRNLLLHNVSGAACAETTLNLWMREIFSS